MRRLLLYLLIALQLHVLYGKPDTLKVEKYNLHEDTEYSNLESNLDSLSTLYYVNDSVDDEADVVEEITDFPDSVYIERLASIPAVVPLPYNRLVKNYIDVYTKKRRDQVEKMLGLADYYFPLFDDIFDYYDVPNEMKYMSIIESGLNPRAYSKARAVGLWQFMYGTGKLYGLEINSYVDERRDPFKATHAAARLSKDLYEQFGDWLLVIAAYNCGPGNVRKAIRRSGGKNNFWEIYYHLPRETRGHVPAFIAATYVMHFHGEHGLYPIESKLPMASDTIMVRQKLHFRQISEVLDIPINQIEDMNPQYRYSIVPGDHKDYAIILPEDKVLSFIDYEDSIYAYKADDLLNKSVEKQKPTYTRTTPTPPSGNYKKLYYTVKPGDNLGYIAEWYGVGLSKVRYWNNIYRNMIRAGQKLVIYVPASGFEKLKDVDSMSFAEKQRMIGKSVSTAQTTSTSNVKIDPNAEYIYYTVKYGDTLWEIAKKYPGVSDKDIMKLNNLGYDSRIKPGQKLKIKKKV